MIAIASWLRFNYNTLVWRWAKWQRRSNVCMKTK